MPRCQGAIRNGNWETNRWWQQLRAEARQRCFLSRNSQDALASRVLRRVDMDGVRRYEDLVAWQLCSAVSGIIFDITGTGPASKDLGFRDQIREAADAPAPLIAEGFVRYTTPEMVRYLRMARAELAEVQTHLRAGEDKRYFTANRLQRARPAVNRAMGTTTNLLKAKLRQLEEEKRRPAQKKPRRR